jgi:hypothetical protein
MCYEFDYLYQQQRAEEARKAQKNTEERAKQKPKEPALSETGVKQPDPVPV